MTLDTTLDICTCKCETCKRSICTGARAIKESDALLDILRCVTGLPWEWYWGDKKMLGVEGTWQLMPLKPKDEGDFWWWHLKHSRQWFDSKHEATTALLTAWFSYMSNVEAHERSPVNPFVGKSGDHNAMEK